MRVRTFEKRGSCLGGMPNEKRMHCPESRCSDRSFLRVAATHLAQQVPINSSIVDVATMLSFCISSSHKLVNNVLASDLQQGMHCGIACQGRCLQLCSGSLSCCAGLTPLALARSLPFLPHAEHSFCTFTELQSLTYKAQPLSHGR